MASIGINVYSFCIFGGDAAQINLQNVVDGKNILVIIKEYIEENFNNYVDNNEKESIQKFVDWQIVSIKDKEKNKYVEYLYGRLKTGNYGVESEIVDKTTGVTTHTQKENEAKVLPFDFMVMLPAGDVLQTVFIMQTQGSYGIKTQLEYGLNSYIHKINMTLRVHFGPLYPREYVEKYLNNGILKKIKLIRYNIPKDQAEKFGIIPGDRKKANKQEIVVSTPLGFTRKKIEEVRECLYGIKAYNKIVEIDGYEYDDLKVEFKLGKKNKTVSLKNINKLVVSEDITEEVELVGGNPTKESIIPIMSETGVGYLIEMGYLEKIDETEEEIIDKHNDDRKE